MAGCPSCRQVLSLMGFFVFVSFYSLRVNLSVAIISMVNSTYLRQLQAAAVAAGANVSVNISHSDLSDEHEPRANDHNSTTHDDDDNNVRALPYYTRWAKKCRAFQLRHHYAI